MKTIEGQNQSLEITKKSEEVLLLEAKLKKAEEHKDLYYEMYTKLKKRFDAFKFSIKSAVILIEE
jgi:hypothetical protein